MTNTTAMTVEIAMQIAMDAERGTAHIAMTEGMDTPMGRRVSVYIAGQRAKSRFEAEQAASEVDETAAAWAEVKAASAAWNTIDHGATVEFVAHGAGVIGGWLRRDASGDAPVLARLNAAKARYSELTGCRFN